jgi:DNA-binding PadR family transcriptional regulator
MSVRDAILGLLTLGPAYGHQLLFELQTRLPHRSTVNPGQVYATLTRLAASDLIQGAGATQANLPLYELTSDGKRVAEAWLRGEGSIDVSDWSEVLDVVLLASTLPDRDTAATCHAVGQQLEVWSAVQTASSDSRKSLKSLESSSRTHHASAVREWLKDVLASEGGPHPSAWGFNDERPGRGRRPNTDKK